MVRKKVEGKMGFISDVAKNSAKSIGEQASLLMKIAGNLYALGFAATGVGKIMNEIKSRLPKK